MRKSDVSLFRRRLSPSSFVRVPSRIRAATTLRHPPPLCCYACWMLFECAASPSSLSLLFLSSRPLQTRRGEKLIIKKNLKIKHKINSKIETRPTRSFFLKIVEIRSRASFERIVDMFCFFFHTRNIKSTRDAVLHNVGGARISVTIVYTSFSGDKTILRDVLVPDIVTSDKLSRGKTRVETREHLVPYDK